MADRNGNPAERNAVVAALLQRHGKTYAEELGIDLAKNTPSPLFRWLCASLLLSARISSNQAMRAAGALAERGWTTAEKLADSTWEQRVQVLNRSGYARYDESTARMLGDTVKHLRDEYGGDLRRRRSRAKRRPQAERKLLKEFKGIGDVGVDIFFREVQTVWDELYPFADKKALAAARRLDLAHTPEELAALIDKNEFTRLAAALVRTDLADDYAAIEHAAAERVRA